VRRIGKRIKKELKKRIKERIKERRLKQNSIDFNQKKIQN
jgi:hypothetical protein